MFYFLPYRFDQLNTSSSHSPSSSSSSNFMRAVTGKTAIGVLQKNIASLKKKIKKFEEEFEIEYGYKPSHSDKMKYKEMKKHMTDLNKYRKELKSKLYLLIWNKSSNQCSYFFMVTNF